MPRLRSLWSASAPPSSTAAGWVSDLALTVLAWASSVPAVYQAGTDQHALEIVVLALTAVPLLLRRVWPVPVFGWTLATAIVTMAWNKYLIDGLALLVALYTVAALRPRRVALVCAGVLQCAVVAGVLRFAVGSWWYNAVLLGGMVAAALGLGLYTAARRAYLAELHDKAERLERERDQQAALAAAMERGRIAREMHDVLAHNLTVMVTLSEAAVTATASSPERAGEVMRNVAETGRRALADTRRLLGVLREGPGRDSAEAHRPPPGLAQLDELVGQVRAAGLDTVLELRGRPPELPSGVQVAVYRLVQEALTNILKHAGTGAQATVRLRFHPDELFVDVVDDGAGTPAAAPGRTGGGLLGMRERIRAYGGEVSARPRDPAGWAVSARLPLDRKDVS